MDCSGLILTQSQFSSNLSPDSGLSELCVNYNNVKHYILFYSILEKKIHCHYDNFFNTFNIFPKL